MIPVVEVEAMSPEEKLRRELDQFTGTSQYYRLTMTPLKSTDGVKFLADNAECYWLISDIAIAYLHLQKKGKDTPFWTFTVNKDGTGVLVGEYDSGVVNYKKKYEFTDFPLQSIKLWIFDNVMLLPSEY